MPDVNIAAELAAEGSYTPVDPYTDLARLTPLKARRFMLAAAMLTNPADPFSAVVASHAAVTALAVIANATDRRAA